MIRLCLFIALVATPTLAYAWPVSPAWLPDPEADNDEEPAPPDEKPASPEPDPKPVEPLAPTSPKLQVPDELLDRIDTDEDRIKALERMQERLEAATTRMKELEWLTHYINAFVDVGAFAVSGNGAGIRSDFQHHNYPGYNPSIAGQWVFMGDPFTTAVNTIGEPADTADSREVAVDTVNSKGRPTMMVNSLGLAIGRWVTDEFAISALAQFLPRPGPDQTEISYAFVTYKPLATRLLWFEVGKIDSVLGIEYRNQDAPNRLEITPSLIARYTAGRPIGISARIVQDEFSGSFAVINGDNFEERFEPDTESRANKVPTLAGHLQWKFPIAKGLELGVSGALGPQDNQSDNSVKQWHYGLDVKLTDAKGWDVIAEFVQGHQQGATTPDVMPGIVSPHCDLADCLRYKGAYILIDHRSASRITPYFRFDWRDATHRRGADFVYEANSVRATLGANFRIADRVHAKLEYISNRELYVPNFPHDVITSSIVLTTE